MDDIVPRPAGGSMRHGRAQASAGSRRRTLPARRRPNRSSMPVWCVARRPRSHRSRTVVPQPIRRTGFPPRRGDADSRCAALSCDAAPGTPAAVSSRHPHQMGGHAGRCARILHGADRRAVCALWRAQRPVAQAPGEAQMDLVRLHEGPGAFQRISRGAASASPLRMQQPPAQRRIRRPTRPGICRVFWSRATCMEHWRTLRAPSPSAWCA